MKIAFSTLGCKINQFDTAAMTEKLRSRNYSLVPFDQDADIYIINTCTVTKKSDYQSRQLIRRAKRNNPMACIIVTGCYAQVNPSEIKKIPEVDLVLGNVEKEDVVDYIKNMVGAVRKPPLQKSVFVRDISLQTRFRFSWVKRFSDRTRTFLKIQDGCSARCSYCIVPIARGPSRSAEPQEIIKQIEDLTAEGYQEVVLSGVHLGTYGKDLTPPINLTCLLEDILDKTRVRRVRLSSIEPMDIPEGLIDLIASTDRICRHLHIPLQSGSPRTLQAMNRDYTPDDYKDLILRIEEKIKGIGIGTDIIAGLPGEGEEDFLATMRLIAELPFSYLHVFPYSIRPGTSAGSMDRQIPERIKEERCKRLRDLGSKKNLDFKKQHIGLTLEVLVEKEKDKETGLLRGLSENYLRVLLKGDDSLKNKIVDVAVEGLKGDNLFGRPKV